MQGHVNQGKKYKVHEREWEGIPEYSLYTSLNFIQWEWEASHN